jgi:hypothetical protein
MRYKRQLLLNEMGGERKGKREIDEILISGKQSTSDF